MLSMFRNQYIISDKEITNINLYELRHKSFEGFHIYFDEALDIFIDKRNNVSVCLIGYIINPFFPENSTEQIIDSILDCCDNTKLMKKLQRLSGRYSLILKNESQYIVI